jgi:glycosyltransferase involved in cell wall biosynthesis
MKNKPLVSICCVTYNHEQYIRDAIESFLIQKTSFPIEIIIHDDASTDNTQLIIKEYSKKDKRIIPILRKTNIYSTGAKVFPTTFKIAHGKYIALCEGDDYWTDSYKLQKQVDFLEKNPKYAMTSHEVEIKFEGIKKVTNYYGKPVVDANLDQIIMNKMFIALNSIVCRKKYLLKIPKCFFRLPAGSHKALILLLSSKGDNYHFLDKMGVKRRHPGGITYKQQKWRKENKNKYQIFLFENLKLHLKGKKDYIINKKLSSLYFKQTIKDLYRLKLISAGRYFLRFMRLKFLKEENI